MTMPTFFCINLDRATKRWSAVRQAMDDRGIPWVRVPAVDGSSPSLSFGDEFCTPRLDKSPQFSRGNAACYISHVKAVHRFFRSGDEHGVICEDDFTFEYEPYWNGNTIPSVIDDAPPGWTTILLSAICQHAPTWAGWVAGGQSYYPMAPVRYSLASAMVYVLTRAEAAHILARHSVPDDQDDFSLGHRLPYHLVAENLFRVRPNAYVKFPPMFTYAKETQSQLHRAHEAGHIYSRMLSDMVVLPEGHCSGGGGGPGQRHRQAVVAFRVGQELDTFCNASMSVASHFVEAGCTVLCVCDQPRDSGEGVGSTFFQLGVQRVDSVPPTADLVFADADLPCLADSPFDEIGIVSQLHQLAGGDSSAAARRRRNVGVIPAQALQKLSPAWRSQCDWFVQPQLSLPVLFMSLDRVLAKRIPGQTPADGMAKAFYLNLQGWTVLLIGPSVPLATVVQIIDETPQMLGGHSPVFLVCSEPHEHEKRALDSRIEIHAVDADQYFLLLGSINVFIINGDRCDLAAQAATIGVPFLTVGEPKDAAGYANAMNGGRTIDSLPDDLPPLLHKLAKDVRTGTGNGEKPDSSQNQQANDEELHILPAAEFVDKLLAKK